MIRVRVTSEEYYPVYDLAKEPEDHGRWTEIEVSSDLWEEYLKVKAKFDELIERVNKEARDWHNKANPYYSNKLPPAT
jgi:hypothetical protein